MKRCSRVSFNDDATHTVEVPIVPSEACADVWYTAQDFEERRSIDHVLVQGCLMGTVPSAVCVRGLEARVEQIESPQTSRRARVDSLVDAVLEVQHKQRAAGTMDSEVIAQACREHSESSKVAAWERGLNDSMQYFEEHHNHHNKNESDENDDGSASNQTGAVSDSSQSDSDDNSHDESKSMSKTSRFSRLRRFLMQTTVRRKNCLSSGRE